MVGPVTGRPKRRPTPTRDAAALDDNLAGNYG
jgi:hypothetical protein